MMRHPPLLVVQQNRDSLRLYMLLCLMAASRVAQVVAAVSVDGGAQGAMEPPRPPPSTSHWSLPSFPSPPRPPGTSIHNIAIGRNAYASSELSIDYTAANAVDGIVPPIGGNSSTFISANATGQWLCIDFGVLVTISSIILYIRRDCCGSELANAEIRFGGAPVYPWDSSNMEENYLLDNMPAGAASTTGGIIPFLADPPRTGRYLTVQNKNVNTMMSSAVHLAVAELQVYGTIAGDSATLSASDGGGGGTAAGYKPPLPRTIELSANGKHTWPRFVGLAAGLGAALLGVIACTAARSLPGGRGTVGTTRKQPEVASWVQEPPPAVNRPPGDVIIALAALSAKEWWISGLGALGRSFTALVILGRVWDGVGPNHPIL
ncbi:hypothetical protein VOLCADRAFT_92173 [Volvox carteri f. nagariensis]|uniref:Fucolectin tachylectin-4 pentraxin-1 domain-containing protein n=1 Tax=Volvox carteri f. nagariensis TaxID=3068 RepID=D8TYT3_VOLCA|nr:uncharacterized protein VOLCADRAFT_92173 [Volvox carteri f. nagariensis]EFJ47367.1 hypothetical protein VOLCADRAFT_92173 [Volvox carteri f. nagariensis]|eukprot:XP_002951556.1 hypothetical protein VOLCADRAFT_92173 [Volvox carteri f. nagariensis]